MNNPGQSHPPGWAIRLLEWFCPDQFLESILGDLVEQFVEDEREFGRRRAGSRFVLAVLRFAHPSILLKNKKVKLMNLGMLKSYLIVAVRTMMKYTFYSSVNVLGLSFAIAFAYLTFTFIQSEMSYDTFHTKHKSIYRLYQQGIKKESGELVNRSAVTATPLARDLASEIPAIRAYSRYGSGTLTVVQNNEPYEDLVCFVDPGFLQIFDFPLLDGDKQSALSTPNSMLLSTTKVKKYFGEVDPIGKSLSLNLNDSLHTFIITGVFDAMEDRSSIPVPILIPFSKFSEVVAREFMESYNYSMVENYVLMESDVSSGISPLLTSALKKFVPDDDVLSSVGVQPLASIHFDADIPGMNGYSDVRRLYVMAGLAVLVIVIALINFITMSLAQALNRLKEIHLRKTMGAIPGQLRFQIVIESFFFTVLASIAGLVIVFFVLPLFNQLLEASLTFHPGLLSIGFLLLTCLIIALISGGLQGVFLMKYEAIGGQKSSNQVHGRNGWLSPILMVVQFALSIILIIGTLMMRAQMNYIQERNLGYDQERLIEISMSNTPDLAVANQQVRRFEVEALKNPGVLEIAGSMNDHTNPWTQLHFLQENETLEKLFFNLVDEGYVEAMGIELVEGRSFSVSENLDAAILVNEALVRYFGWTDPLNQQIPGKNFEKPHRIIGVFRDFHFNSLHQKVEPLILAVKPGAISDGVTGLSTYVWPPNLYQILVRVGPGELEPVLDHLERTWKETQPARPFVYRFVDDLVDQRYAEEKRWNRIINAASVFALLIAWLGLLGLTRLSVQKRTKEIGIRKVLGSSVSSVILHLSGKFVLLVALANLLAWPMAWWGISRWLESFSYRIDLSILTFVLAGIGVLIVAVVSVGLQSYRAALADPAQSLKYE